MYTFGAWNEISFDAEMAGLYGSTPLLDLHRPCSELRPFPTGQPVGKGTFSFHPVGLGPVSLDPDKADDLVLENQKCKVSASARSLPSWDTDVLKY